MPEKKVQKNGRTAIRREINFHKIYSTNLIGGGTKYDFRFELLSEKIKGLTDDRWIYVSDALIILTPQAAKKLHTTLDKYLKAYEKDHGEIEDPDTLDPDMETNTG